MQAVILAGGKGTRLRPITYEIPKPLIEINNKPFLQYQLELIKSFGISRVLILVGYLGKKIEKYFRNGLDLGLKIEYSYEKTLLGTGGALKNAEEKVAEEFLLLNGDTFLAIDYGRLIDYFRQRKKIGIITVYDNYQKIGQSNVALGKQNLVIKYDKREAKGMTHIDAGAMVFRKIVLGLIPKGKICSLEEEIFPLLIKAKQLVAFPTKQRFYDIGDPKRLKEIKKVLK